MKRYRGVVLGVVAAIAVAGTALAEGEFTSFMTNVRDGFNSRTWHDSNLDGVSTNIKLEGCRDEVPGTDPNDWGKLSLEKENWIFPSENLGTKQFSCWVSATQFWGDVAASDYHFTVRDYSGPDMAWNVFDASKVVVKY
jgi:hypothetical protein